MKVGVTGHQNRANLDWNWVQDELFRQLEPFAHSLTGYSSLASGADQSFADVVVKLGGKLNVVLPFPGYENTFESEKDLARFRRLIASSVSVEEMQPADSEQRSYLLTGMRIVDLSEAVFAVWDGHPAVGLGGTADIVAYALRLKRQIVHINTRTKTSNVLGKS